MPQKRRTKVAKGLFLVVDPAEEEIKGTGATPTEALKEAEDRAEADCETLTENHLVLAQVLWNISVHTSPRLSRGEPYE